jgi:hypothetical protein
MMVAGLPAVVTSALLLCVAQGTPVKHGGAPSGPVDRGGRARTDSARSGREAAVALHDPAAVAAAEPSPVGIKRMDPNAGNDIFGLGMAEPLPEREQQRCVLNGRRSQQGVAGRQAESAAPEDDCTAAVHATRGETAAADLDLVARQHDGPPGVRVSARGTPQQQAEHHQRQRQRRQQGARRARDSAAATRRDDHGGGGGEPLAVSKTAI